MIRSVTTKPKSTTIIQNNVIMLLNAANSRKLLSDDVADRIAIDDLHNPLFLAYRASNFRYFNAALHASRESLSRKKACSYNNHAHQHGYVFSHIPLHNTRMGKYARSGGARGYNTNSVWRTI